LNFLYKFPENAYFGKVLSKSKIYEHASPSSAVKNLFVREVEKIIWSYKLSPETINLPVKGNVHEIQVFTIELKTGSLKHEVLQTIDKVVPSPILYVLSYENQVRYVAAYKRQSEADKSRWVVSSYFETDWMSYDTEMIDLPVVLNMGALYQSFLKSLSPLNFRKDESLDSLVSRVDQLRVKERETVKLDNRIKKEKQFNRRVELNRALKGLKAETGSLKDE